MAKKILGVELYTYQEVVELLEVSEATIRRLIKKKIFTPTRLGSHNYINKTQILKYLQ